MRSKQDYILVENEKGKMVPEKVGMKSVTRDGVDYEFTLNFDIDIKNFAVAIKDRTSLFKNAPEAKITEETGKTIIDWCNDGAELPAPTEDQFNAIITYLKGNDNEKESAQKALTRYKFSPEQLNQISELS